MPVAAVQGSDNHMVGHGQVCIYAYLFWKRICDGSGLVIVTGHCKGAGYMSQDTWGFKATPSASLFL